MSMGVIFCTQKNLITHLCFILTSMSDTILSDCPSAAICCTATKCDRILAERFCLYCHSTNIHLWYHMHYFWRSTPVKIHSQISLIIKTRLIEVKRMRNMRSSTRTPETTETVFFFFFCSSVHSFSFPFKFIFAVFMSLLSLITSLIFFHVFHLFFQLLN